MIVGIDPGVSGAYSIILPSGGVAAFDVPTTQVTKTKKEMDGRTVVYALRELIKSKEMFPSLKGKEPLLVGLEDVHAMPKQGVSSTFKFGRNVGQWEGILWSLQATVLYVTPQAWKKEFGLLKKDKDAARKVASDLFPSIRLSRKKDIGKADALLIAEYVRRKYAPK